ncbi:MAG: glycerol-3-phosphate dehydrogenase, partial [Pseudomonadota bacterium]|nr:glycerol-3-phosphate dehydrogenase [Pseudomonadota bacterium]
MSIKRAAVIGGGSFGTVIANILADNGVEILQWMRNESVAESINHEHV